MGRLVKVWWRRELVQVVHVQGQPGRTVCGLDIPDGARTAPGREVACEVCRAALAEAARPAARPAEPVVEAARVADLVAEVERLQAQLRAARPKIATLEQVRDRLSAEKVELLKREEAAVARAEAAEARAEAAVARAEAAEARAEAAVARAEAAEAELEDARAEIELLRLSLADERRRVEQRDRLGVVRAGRRSA